MAKIGPKTCKTAQNYMSEVDSKMPARARAFRFANHLVSLLEEAVMLRRAWL